MKRLLTRERAETLARRLLTLADGGNVQAMKIIFERVDGPAASPAVAVAVNTGAVILPETKSKAPFDYAGFARAQRELFGFAGSEN